MHRSTVRRALLTCAALALLAACSKSYSSLPSTSPTPVPSGSPGAIGTPSVASVGVAYVPDGGGAGQRGVEVVHFEDTSGNLLAKPAPVAVVFPGAVEELAISSDTTVGIGAMSRAAAAPYPLIQDLSGFTGASPVLVGPAYDAAIVPSPAPNATPTAAAVIPDIAGVAVLGTGQQSVGLAVGGTNGILATSALTNSSFPFAYGGFASFMPASGSTVTVPAGTRNNITASPLSPTTGTFTVLVRGQDLLVYDVTQNLSGSGYLFTITAEDATLGTTPSLLRGNGAMALTSDGSRAVLAQAQGPDTVALITGLPTAIKVAATLTLPSRPHSVAISPNGAYAAVGTDGGVFLVSGVSGSTLAMTGPLVATYTGSDGLSHQLVNVSSVGFTLDGRYLVALALLNPGVSTVGSVVVLPFNQSAAPGSPTPSPAPTGSLLPTMFVQSGITTGGIDLDNLVVR